MKMIAVCGPNKSGRTTIAQVFKNNNWYGFNLDEYRSEEKENTLLKFRIDFDKLKNQLLLGAVLTGIVIHDINTIEEAEYLKNLGFKCLYLRTPGVEYAYSSGAPNQLDYAVPGLSNMCDHSLENTGLLSDLEASTLVFYSIIKCRIVSQKPNL